MTTRQELEQAIAVLEAHRDILENDVVDTAAAALRQKLTSLQSSPPDDRQQKMVVLVADLSGFTAVSETMDAEEVRDMINEIWRILDSVIVAWGGKVDQHIGDGVVALFQVVSDLEDCKERAVLAALDMQKELSLFSREQKKLTETGSLIHLPSASSLGMRIGIHTGLVVFGKVGSSNQYTAVGDVVAIANQLEQASPIGGILISDETYEQIQHYFDTDTLPPLLLAETNEYIQVHIVRREKRHALQDVGRESIPGEASFVGRNDELAHLQFILETVIESDTVQVVTILGEVGIGKTRLRKEFEKLLALQPTPVRVFKGKAEEGLAYTPYAAMHRLMANYFDIHRRSSPAVARAKLIEGITTTLPDADEHGLERAHFIGHVLGFDFNDSPYLQNLPHNARRIREYAFQDMARFFTAVTDDGPAVLFLENMESIDEGSLELLEYLVRGCAERPLLIICLARPNLFTRWPAWQLHHSFDPQTYSRLDLPPLSSIDSRHMIASRLQNIPRIPQRLNDLLVDAAGGNPFLITEIIDLLGEIGVIIKGSKQWRIQMGQLNDLRGKLTLEWLLDKQLERLTPIERTILNTAAVIGQVFWETAVAEIVRIDDPSISIRQIQAALRTLEQQELIIRHTTALIPRSVEYRFWHDTLHQVAYDACSEPRRRQTHAHYAQWLQDRSTEHLPNLEATVAHHQEQAGDRRQAAQHYARAARQAAKQYAPETAIRYYRQALTLLPSDSDALSQRIQINDGLGQALQQQSRFDEAITTFTDVYNDASGSGDLETADRAFRSMFFIHSFQGEFQAALKMGQQAEAKVRPHNKGAELATTLAVQGWAFTHLGDLPQALKLGRQALTVATKAESPRGMAYGHALIGLLGLILRKFDQAQSAIEKALALFLDLGDRPWEGIMLHYLGRIHLAQSDYAQASTYLEESVQLARDIGDNHGAMRSLLMLSQVAQKQNAYAEAEDHQKQALIWAEKSGDVPSRIMVATHLGRLHRQQYEIAETAVAQSQHLREARACLDRGWQLVDQTQQTIPRVKLHIEMAELLLAEQDPDQALNQIREALVLANQKSFLEQGTSARETCAVAWRTAGNIAVELPETELPLWINNRAYNVAGCFQQSLHILSLAKYELKEETARTLFAWAVYELRWGSHQRGETLWQRTQNIYAQLGLREEISKMEHFAL